VSYTIKL